MIWKIHLFMGFYVMPHKKHEIFTKGCVFSRTDLYSEVKILNIIYLWINIFDISADIVRNIQYILCLAGSLPL